MLLVIRNNNDIIILSLYVRKKQVNIEAFYFHITGLLELLSLLNIQYTRWQRTLYFFTPIIFLVSLLKHKKQLKTNLKRFSHQPMRTKYVQPVGLKRNAHNYSEEIRR